METNEEILKKQMKAYNFIPLLFEIIKTQKHRELAFIVKKGDKKIAVRYLIALNINYFKKHLKWINYDKRLFNTYQSVAQLKDIPVFSYNLAKRLEEEKYKEFNKDYEKHIIGYDFFLDFDGKEDFEKCHQEAKEMKKILDDFKVPYYILNSSKNGFHFRVPAEFMPKLNLYSLNEVLYNLKGIYDFACLDETVIDNKRLCKIPYSVCEKVICLPLNDFQFENFTPELVEIDNVLSKIKIKNRGLLLRTHNLAEEQLKKNVEKFLSEFE